MTNLIRPALAGLLALFAVSASAQQFPVVPDHTVVGRIGTTGQSGPSQAIPFATLVAQLNALAATSSVTTDYTITPNDCGKTIRASSGYFGLTLPAAATFPANCSLTIIDGDAGSGKKLIGFPSGLTSPNMLWPLQSLSLRMLSNTWAVTSNPGRWKAPTGTVVYMDALAGNDTNDCLAPATACQSFNGALRTNVHDYFDLSGSSTFFNNSGTPQIFVQLADNATAGACSTCYSLAHIAFGPVGTEGRASIVIRGNTSTPGSTVIAQTGGVNMGVYGAVNLELNNLQIGQTSCASSPKAEAGIQAYDGANVRIEAGVILGCVNSSQISTGFHGAVVADQPFSIAGGGQWFIQAQDQSEANVSNVAITCIGATLTYSQQVVSATQGAIVNLIGTSYAGIGCSSVTGSKFNAAFGGQIYTNTGCSVTSCTGIIGATNGTLTSTGSIDNYLGLSSGIDINFLNDQTTNYSIASSDCGKIINAHGGFFTLTLPSVAGFSGECVVTVRNSDTTRGKKLAGFPAAILSPTILWPEQTLKVGIENGAWRTLINPGRWAVTGPTFFVDTAGNDTNDGLATGAGAFLTLAKCANVAQLYVDTLSGGNGGVTCSPTSGQTFQESIQVFFPLVGGGSLIFQGNGGAFIWKPVNSGSALQVGDLGVVGLTSVTFSSAGVTTPASFVVGHNTGIIDFNTGVSLTPTVSIVNGIDCDYDTHININNGLTINAGTFSNYVLHGCQNSTWNINGTQTFVGTPVFNRYAVFDTGATATFQGNVTFSGAATGSPMLVTDNATVNNFTGSTYPGGTPITLKGGLICTAVGTCAANVVLTTDVTGTLPVANGGTGDTGTAWPAFTPSPACGTATFTVTSATRKTEGKKTVFEIDTTITALGTCTNTLSFSLPLTAQSAGGLSGREGGVSAKATACSFAASATTATCSLGDASNFAVNARLQMSGVYENQ